MQQMQFSQNQNMMNMNMNNMNQSQFINQMNHMNGMGGMTRMGMIQNMQPRMNMMPSQNPQNMSNLPIRAGGPSINMRMPMDPHGRMFSGGQVISTERGMGFPKTRGRGGSIY